MKEGGLGGRVGMQCDGGEGRGVGRWEVKVMKEGHRAARARGRGDRGWTREGGEGRAQEINGWMTWTGEVRGEEA